MRDQFKRYVRAIVPPRIIYRVQTARGSVMSRAARAAFEGASSKPKWLDPKLISVLQRRYPLGWGYHSDPTKSLWLQGAERARQMKPFLPMGHPRTLELACYDAMVSYQLAQKGARAFALDIRADYVDPRARDAGVYFVGSNAEHLPFEDNSFDFVFSYNAFEHFSDPQTVFAEALRAVRPGGVLYFRFGPLYRSAFGLHAMHCVTVPFCQHLFERSAIEEYVTTCQLERIEFETLNEWTLQQFRDLWDERRPWAEKLLYREIPDVQGLDLICEYPSCFRSKTDNFEDLLLATIEIAFRRTDRSLTSL